MTQYRKKPVVVEAVQWTSEFPAGLPRWLQAAWECGDVDSPDGENLYINTPGGCVTAGLGDWIIRSVAGGLSFCSPEIFAATYEPADAAPPAALAPMTRAAADVLAERNRQVEEEGWTPAHDDAQVIGSMSIAAACYALSSLGDAGSPRPPVKFLWRWTRWSYSWFKPKDRRYDLVRAGALIIAEIERLDRAAVVDPKVNA